MRLSRLLPLLALAVAISGPAPAQEPHLACSRFAIDIEGDWIAKHDTAIRRAGKTALRIKAGEALPDEIQDRLEDQCAPPGFRLALAQRQHHPER
jgi:hypothetical protein